VEYKSGVVDEDCEPQNPTVWFDKSKYASERRAKQWYSVESPRDHVFHPLGVKQNEDVCHQNQESQNERNSNTNTEEPVFDGDGE